jgi:single-strand DNA-binding protein
MNLNKVTIVGRLTRDPEMKSLPSGMAVTSMSIATSQVFNDRDGKRQENAEYHNIVVFGKQAEASARFLKKGQLAAVAGRLQTRSWDKDGVKHYRTEIVADTIQFGPRSGETEEAVIQTDGTASPMPEYPSDEINPDDIPF